MATYYISKAGNDSYTGLSGSGKLTIAAALTVATSDGDTVEIIDEGTYVENNLTTAADNLTITHTASNLGYARIDGGGAASSRCFKNTNSGTIFQGLELFNAVQPIYNGAGGNPGQFHVTGCFIHDVQRFNSNAIQGASGNPTSIKESVLYFHSSSYSKITIDYNVILRNCLITASISDDELVTDYGGAGSTASFCTFVTRPAVSATDPIVRIGKIINCIVTSMNSNGTVGVASDDHTYNLVGGPGMSASTFKNHANNSNGSAGTGDITEQDPTFVDGDSQGSGASIAAKFQLQSTSPAINYGTPYQLTTFDLTGAVRPTTGGAGGSSGNPDMGCFEFIASGEIEWGSYTTPPSSTFGSDLRINLYENLSADYKLPSGSNLGQVPFSLGPKGPFSLRGRAFAYGVSKGGDPATIIQTSSA